MRRLFSVVRHASGSSAASSLLSPFVAKLSVRCYGGLGALRSYGSRLGSPCLSNCFLGLQQNNGDSLIGVSQSFDIPEHFRGFSSMNFRWNNMNENVNASHGFHPDSQKNINPSSNNDSETRKSSTPMDFVRGIIEQDGAMRGAQLSRYNLERDADFVHVKLLKNNTFVTVTDSKGNIKLSASAGCLKEMKGGQKLSKYAAEATAEEVGRRARRLGLKSVVMRVKGFTYFRKKRQAIVSWRDGFTDSRGGRNPIVYIEDTTQIPHNGCRLPKRRRI